MEGNDVSGFDSFNEPQAPVEELTGEGVPTQTIDLSSLFTEAVYSSGTFDLSDVGSTALARLLDALPVPAMLIDQEKCLWFTNKACVGLSAAYRKMRGAPFLDFVARPSDTDKASALAAKVHGLLERVFTTRKPQVAEAILEISKKRMWARLHLRAIRICSRRHLLALIEDLTHEKGQIELNRRREEDFRKALLDIETQLQVSRRELLTTAELHRREAADHLRTQTALRVERQKWTVLSEQTPLAAAVIAPSGTFQYINRRFREMFGYEVEELPHLREWITGTEHDSHPLEKMISNWLERCDRTCEDRTTATKCSVLCRDTTTKAVNMTGLRLDDGHYFVTCEETDERDGGEDMS